MTSLLTAASVIPLAAWGSDEFYATVILVALLSGMMQIALGIARMGVLLNFLSHPVLMGFINAAAIIIGLSQFAPLIGMSLRNSKHLLSDIAHVLASMDEMHAVSLLFGVVSLALMVALRRLASRLPGVLIVVVLATFASSLIGFEAMGGRVVGRVPEGLPRLGLPSLDWKVMVTLIPMALVVALVSFVEAMSSGKIIAIRTRTPWDENQELIGQGLAKVAAAFSGTMPVSGSFSRSALNLAAGAKTGVSSIVTSAAVLLMILFFTPLLYHLPRPTLSAVIILAVFNLIDLKAFSAAWRASRHDGVAAGMTFVVTLALAPNIQYGILTGIIVSLGLFLFRTMTPRIVLLGLDEHGQLQNAERYNLPRFHPKVTALRFDGQLYFANVSYFEQSVVNLVSKDPNLRYLLVDSRGINGLDASGVEMLRGLVHRLRSNGIELAFCNIKGPVVEVMRQTGLLDQIGAERIFLTEQAALKDFEKRLASATAQA
jgi:SulP family sulfate permease